MNDITPRPTRMQVEVEDLDLFGEWLTERHEAKLAELDRYAPERPEVEYIVGDLQRTRELQRKIAAARARCYSPASTEAESGDEAEAGE